MKLSLLKENIKNELGAIERVAPKSHTLPVLGNVLLETEKNFLKLTTTDLNIAIHFWILCKIEQEGKLTVPVRLLGETIRTFPEEKIQIESKQNTLILSGEFGNTQILGQSPDDFPIIPNIQQEYSFNMDCDSFCESLSHVLEFTASPSGRQELTGVYVNIHPKGIVFAATDSFRLAEKKTVLSTEKKTQEKEYSFLVPQKFFHEFLAFAQERRGTVKIYLSQNQIVLDYQGEDVTDSHAQFIGRLLEGEFPPYKEIIPESYHSQVIVSREGFIRVLRSASVMSPKTNDVIISVSPKKKGIEIESKSPDKGEYRSFFPAECAGEELSLHFNWRFILDGLLHIRDAEVLLGFQKNEKPAVIRPKEDASYVYVVMPMRSE